MASPENLVKRAKQISLFNGELIKRMDISSKTHIIKSSEFHGVEKQQFIRCVKSVRTSFTEYVLESDTAASASVNSKNVKIAETKKADDIDAFIDLTQLSDSDDDNFDELTDKSTIEDIERIIEKMEKKNTTNMGKHFKKKKIENRQDFSVPPILPNSIIDLTMINDSEDDDEIVVEKNESVNTSDYAQENLMSHEQINESVEKSTEDFEEELKIDLILSDIENDCIKIGQQSKSFSNGEIKNDSSTFSLEEDEISIDEKHQRPEILEEIDVNLLMEEKNSHNYVNTVNVLIEEKMQVDDVLTTEKVVENVDLENTIQSQEETAENIVQISSNLSKEKIQTKSTCVAPKKDEISVDPSCLSASEVVEKVNVDKVNESQDKLETQKTVALSKEILKKPSILDASTNDQSLEKENSKIDGLKKVDVVENTNRSDKKLETKEVIKVLSKISEEELKTKSVHDSSKDQKLYSSSSSEQEIVENVNVDIETKSQKKPGVKKITHIYPKVDRRYKKKSTRGAFKKDQDIDPCTSSGRKRSHSDNQTPKSHDKKIKLDNNLEATFQHLMGLFPDADEEYMKNIALNTYRHNRSFVAFVNSNVQDPRYQKKIVEKKPQKERVPKDSSKKLKTPKIQDTLASYTTNFDILNFLKIYPHPKHYFEDSKRVCQSSKIALEFLQSKFKKCPVNELKKIYQSNNNNLSLTAKKLSNLSYKPETEVKNLVINPEVDLKLLQEIAFVNNREKIKEEYLKIKKIQKEKSKIDNLQAEKKFLECQCCFDEKCSPSECAKCENGHIFCKSCIIKGVNESLAIGDTHVFCFAICKSEFSLATLKEVLETKTFEIIIEKRQSATTVAKEKNLFTCPSCNYTSVSPLDGETIKCLNPLCMSEPCTDSERNEKARKFIEEKMSQALLRNCSNCQRIFIKDYGCNMMLCFCGTSMCYLCNKVVKGDSHFRKQGENIKKNETPKCPYYSDDHFLNAQTVRKIAEEVKKELLEKIPTLDIDIEKLLPSIPPQADGPHKHIPENPDIADLHVEQILEELK